MADTNTKIIIDVSLNSEDATKKAQDLGGSIKVIKEEQKALKAAGKETDVAYQSNATNLRLLTQEQKAYISIANAAEGSNNQLRAQLSLLTQQYNALGKEERDGTVAGKALQVQIKGLSDEIKTNEEKVGDHRRSVGDYEKANRSATESIAAQKQELTSMGGVVAQAPIGFKLLGDQIGAVKNQITNFRQASLEAKAAQQEFASAQKIATEATKASEEATEKATAIGFQFSTAQQKAAEASKKAEEALKSSIAVGEDYVDGKVTASEAERARVAALEAERVATIAAAEADRLQAAATETQIVATNTATVATAAETTALEAQTAATAAATNATKIFKIALASTGIGALIVLVAGLVAYLSKFDPVVDKLERAFAGVKAVFDTIGRVVVSFVSNLTSVRDLLGKIGNFIQHPIDSFRELGTAMSQAANAAMELKRAQQDLEDQNKIQEVANAKALQQVEKLTIQAKNRSLSEKERQKLLAEANKIDQKNFDQRTKIANDEIALAQKQIGITAGLNAQEMKMLEERGLEYAFQLKDRAAVTDEEVDALKDAELKRTSILSEATSREERRQNLSDQIAEKAAAAEEKRQQRIQKAREESADAENVRLESLIKTNESLVSERQNEIDSVNREIDEKVAKYRKYGATTEQLERERVARLRQIDDEFHKNTLAEIQANMEEIEDLMISQVADQGERELMQIATNNQRKIAQQDLLIQQTKDRIQKGEEGLTELLLSQQNLREELLYSNQTQIDAKQEQIRIEKEQRDIELYDQELEREQSLADAKQKIQEEQFDLMLAGTDLLAAIFNKNTALGKAAFLAQKALAIAEIVINTQRAIAANIAAEQAQNLSYSLIPFVGAGMAFANSVKHQAERTKILISGAIAGATILATAVSGFQTGGVYKSDGRGGVLPGYSKVDDTNAKLRSGEAVIVSEAARDPKALAALSAINVAYGGAPLAPGVTMATGGIAQSLQGGHVSQLTTAVNNSINEASLIEAIKAMPAPIVEVREIVTAAQTMEAAKVRANL